MEATLIDIRSLVERDGPVQDHRLTGAQIPVGEAIVLYMHVFFYVYI